MKIKRFIKILNKLPEDTMIEGIFLPDSSPCRGDYFNYCIAEGNFQHSVKDIIEFLNDVIKESSVHIAYKGDKMRYDENSQLVYGIPDCGGYPIDGILLDEDGFSIKKQKYLYY